MWCFVHRVGAVRLVLAALLIVGVEEQVGSGKVTRQWKERHTHATELFVARQGGQVITVVHASSGHVSC